MAEQSYGKKKKKRQLTEAEKETRRAAMKNMFGLAKKPRVERTAEKKPQKGAFDVFADQLRAERKKRGMEK